MNDWMVSAGVYAAAAVGLEVYAYGRRSRRTLIRPTMVSHALFLVRLGVLVLLIHAGIRASGVPLGWGYLVLALLSLLTAVSLLGVYGLMAGFLLHEWVFWFPSREDVTHTRTLRSVRTASVRPNLQGSRGVAVTPLRPAGKVRIGTDEVEASSVDGFVESGQGVTVLEDKPFGVLVAKDAAD